MVVASVVSPDESALWSDLRKLVIWPPVLELLLAVELLLLEEEFGPLERRSDIRLEASDVSPDCKSLPTASSAFSSGFSELDEPFAEAGP
jgi:hypothetical protein